MALFQAVLISAAFLCSLVAGFLFAYAIVVMPGISRLDDRAFIRAFQVTDRVIQDNQPVFILVWAGSAITLVVAAIMGYGRVGGVEFGLLSIATLAYLLGVQLPTMRVNLPLNNRLQQLNVDSMSEADLKVARDTFEPRWNASNRFRTLVSACVTVLLIILIARL